MDYSRICIHAVFEEQCSFIPYIVLDMTFSTHFAK